MKVFYQEIKTGQRDKDPVNNPTDGHWLSQTTNDLKVSLHMTSGEASHFVKAHMLNINFGETCIVVKKKNGKNGGNVYRVVNLLAESEQTQK